MLKPVHVPGERLVIVVFGPSSESNDKLMRAALRMPGLPRIAIVGERSDLVDEAIAAGRDVEVFPVGTEPPSGDGVLVLSEAGIAAWAARGDAPLNS